MKAMKACWLFVRSKVLSDAKSHESHEVESAVCEIKSFSSLFDGQTVCVRSKVLHDAKSLEGDEGEWLRQ